MAKQIVIGEIESYKGMYGYAKKKAMVHVVSPGQEANSGNAKAYIKGEPIMDEEGKQVTWVWYVKGSIVPKNTPIHFTTPRAIKKFLTTHLSQFEVDADTAYEKAGNFVPVIGGGNSATEELVAQITGTTKALEALDSALNGGEESEEDKGE